MRRLTLVLLYLGAVALGLGSAWWSVRHHGDVGAAAGPWRMSTLTGSPDADTLTRARVAVRALLALERRETMYYLAQTDSLGAPLRSRCRYRISGEPPAARWWSVTAYAEDHFLFPDPGQRYSLNGSTARLDGQGRFELVSGPSAPSAGEGVAWLPTPGDRGLVFTLRAYQPAPALAAQPLSLAPPRIERLGDCP